MNYEVPDTVCGTLSGVTQRLGSPSWIQWNVRLVTELDWRYFWFLKLGQFDSVEIRPFEFGEISANWIWSDSDLLEGLK